VVHFGDNCDIRRFGIACCAGFFFAYLAFIRWTKLGRLPISV